MVSGKSERNAGGITSIIMDKTKRSRVYRIGSATITAMLAILLLADGGGAATLTGISSYTPALFFSDDFNGSALNSVWTVINKNSDSRISLTGTGYLRINASPKNGGSDYYIGSNYNAPRILYNLSRIGSMYGGIIETKMIFSPTNNYQGAGILSCSEDNPDSNTCLRVAERAFYPQAGGSVVRAGPGTYVPYTNSTTYFRLLVKGTSGKGWFSSNGVNWILNWEGTVSSIRPKYLGLFAIRQPWDYNTTVYSAADFDYINFVGFNGTTLTVDDSGGADYTRIQDAIDNATAGDTILVYSGLYHENINVNKQLILRGIDSNGGGAPVIDGRWSGNAIWIGSSGVIIEGFNIRNSSAAGINVNSNSNVIRSNRVSNNQHGIDIPNSANNTISNNNVSLNNGVGILLFNSSGNTISGNIASSNGKVQTEENGIAIQQNSNYNLVTGNIANSNGNKGIEISMSYRNTVRDNKANSNGREGIYLRYSNFTLIRNNTVNSNPGNGILLQYSNNNSIIDNNASNSLDHPEGYHSSGIRLESSNNNRISSNAVASNTAAGISIESSSSNTIASNNRVWSNDRGGIFLHYSNFTLVGNNIISSNRGNGILLHYSNNNKITGNNASNSRNYPEGYNSSGIKLEYSDHNIISNNTGISNNEVGVDLYYSDESTIFNNSLFYNKAGIAIGDSSNFNIVTSNSASSNRVAGINVFKMSSDNLVKGNIARNNSDTGISLFYAGENNTIIGNVLYGNGYEGIWLKDSSNNGIYDNIISNNGEGIVLKDSSNYNKLMNNTMSANIGDGIVVMNSSYSRIEKNIARNNRGFEGIAHGRPPSTGISILGSHNVIKNNNASNNFIGIGIFDGGPTGDIVSVNNTIEGNVVKNNTGINVNNKLSSGILVSSSHNSIFRNTASNNLHGILLVNSTHSRVEGNIASNNRIFEGDVNGPPPSTGIIVVGSDNAIRNNNASNNFIGIGVFGGGPEGNIVTVNNTIEGNVVKNNTGMNDVNKPPSSGLLLKDANNNTMANNIVSFNERGIRLFTSRYNTIKGNTVTYNNLSGIKFNDASIKNKILNNIVNNNNASGIELSLGSNYNTIASNKVNSNLEYGIHIDSSSSNTIYNNIFNNKNNFRIWNNSINKWNIVNTSGVNIIGGSRLGGNFWTYPNGSGFSKTCADSNKNGFCDSNYTLNRNNIDYLPLTDKVPPRSITNLINRSYAQNYINWTWTDPSDADFSYVKVFIDGYFKFNIAKGKKFYNATGFLPNTRHNISTRTVDIYGNINKSWKNHSARTKPDAIPPRSITNLNNRSYARNYINWTWTDPNDYDFSSVRIYINGTFKKNVPKGVRYYNATNLTSNRQYNISTRTADTSGNVNKTWVNRSAKTAP